MAVSNHTIICGLERISLRVATALIQLGERVTIIGESPDPALLREARRVGAQVVQGRTADLAQLRGVDLGAARCIVLTEDDDLANLQAALGARDLNPAIRVVLRMFDADLAERAIGLLDNTRVVSTSAEAAPYFAAAALGVEPEPARLAWGRHVVLKAASANGGPSANGTGGEGAEGSRAEPPVRLGDDLLYLVEPQRSLRPKRFRRLGVVRRGLLALADPRLIVLAAVVATLVTTSVVVFHSARDLYPGSAQATASSWVDALVFTVTTAYGNTDLSHAALWLKVYAVGFMIAAALGLALTFGLIADVTVGSSIMEALGAPRGRMRNHVVVLGLGSVGYRTVLQLVDAGTEVAASDSWATGQFVALVRRMGVPVLIADRLHLGGLRALSVPRAHAVVAASSNDLTNLGLALAARELNPRARVIMRVFGQELADRAQQFRITACLSVSALATPAFVAAALGDSVLTTLEGSRRLWLLAETRVMPGSQADGMTVEALEATLDLRVLATQDGERRSWRSNCPQQLSAGTSVLVACSREAWLRLREQAGHLTSSTAEPANRPPAG
jgi:Trk K+ transport system NAD-binding subunit